MDVGTRIAIVVGSVNLLALAFVVWQATLTRKAVQMAQRTREISDLPEAYAVIHVQYSLNKWKSELEQIIKDRKCIKAQILTDDTTLGEKYGLTTPKGLIPKPMYDYLPPWLRIIWISAAQYYYACKSNASLLSYDRFDREAKLRLLSNVVGDARAYASRVKEMLSYIEKMIPEWFLNCPASTKEDQFMDR